jgi:hypothetical protein
MLQEVSYDKNRIFQVNWNSGPLLSSFCACILPVYYASSFDNCHDPVGLYVGQFPYLGDNTNSAELTYVARFFL